METDQRNDLRRLRRWARKLGYHVSRTADAGGGYWVVDAMSSGIVGPRKLTDRGSLNLADVEKVLKGKAKPQGIMLGARVLSTNDNARLRRLRRRAAKLGEMGMRIDQDRYSGGYLLTDVMRNVIVAPRFSGGHCTLDDIEEEIAAGEKTEGIEEQRTRLRQLRARARKLGLQITTMRKYVGYWVIDKRNTGLPGGQELTLDRLERFLTQHERDVPKKRRR